MYINPSLESSYRDNDIGKTLYDVVIKLKPKKIIEFGTLNGYSAIAMGMALKDLGEGHIICYDLWDKYPYKHTTMKNTIDNIEKYGLSQYISCYEQDYYEWLNRSEIEQFDLLHLDISNDGSTIEKTYSKLENQIKNGVKVIFEGGSVERDNIEWMIKYNKKPINSIKGTELNYEILNEMFPSISMIKI